MVSGRTSRIMLGPLLFLLYVNDLHSPSNFNATLVANDTTLKLSEKNLKNWKKS